VIIFHHWKFLLENAVYFVKVFQKQFLLWFLSRPTQTFVQKVGKYWFCL